MKNLNTFTSILISSTFSFFDEIDKHQELNNKKIKEVISKYIQSKNLPRKLKKKVRKECISEYNFWITIKKWEEQFQI